MDHDDVIVISCLWCSDVSFPSTRLYDYIQATAGGVSESAQCEQWISDATHDLCNCSDCVDEYHRAVERAFQDDPRFAIDLKEQVYTSDVARLEKCLSSILTQCREHGHSGEELSEEDKEDMMMFWSTQRSTALQREFECPMMEILKYPRLLLNRRVNELFVSALDEMEAIDQQLEVHGKYPGVYLLLVHPSQKVRRWAMGVVQSLGQVDWDDYDSLEEVLTWMVTVITFDQFVEPLDEPGPAAWDDSQTLILPKYLFIHNSPKEFWVGVCMFITALSGPCIRSRFICNHKDLVHAIVNTLDCHTSTSVAFWPALQCLRTLLDQLGSRFWQFTPTNSSFDYVLKCIVKSPHFEAELVKWGEETFESSLSHDGDDADDATNSQVVYGFLEETLDAQPSKSLLDVSPVDTTSSVRRQRLPFTWIIPFLQSLLDFGETAFEAIDSLFHAVHSFPSKSSSNLSPLFNESLFTLSQMVELLFSKKAFSIMYRFKAKWLPAVEIALKSVNDISYLSSLTYMFMVLLGILDTDEAKELPKTEKVVSYLKKFTPLLKFSRHQKGAVTPPNNIIKHVTKVLEILAKTHTSPTLSEQPELQAMEIEEQEQQPLDLGTERYDKGFIKVKSEPNFGDSSSETSTVSDSIPDNRTLRSKGNSRSPRKARRVPKNVQARKKSDVSLRKISSSESTDELEDFEPPAQSHAKQKSPSKAKSKTKVARPRVLFSEGDTTDDMYEDTKPNVFKIKSEDTNDDDVFEVVNKPEFQSLKLSTKSSPVPVQYQPPESYRQKLQQSSLSSPASTTPTKKTSKLSLKRHKCSPKSDSADVHTQTQRLSIGARLSFAQDSPLSLSSTHVQPRATTAHQKPSISAATIDLSADDMKDFENFSDTEAETDDNIISLVKNKGRIKGSFLSSTDIESGSESQGSYHGSSKKDKSVEKVHKWLDSSSEGSTHGGGVTQSVAQLVNQTDKTIKHCAPTASMEQQLSRHAEVVYDTSDEHSKFVTQFVSSKEQGDIEIEPKNTEDTSRSGRDKVSPESTSSSSSSLPPVMWEQKVKVNSAKKIESTLTTKPEKSIVEHKDLIRITCNQLQSSDRSNAQSLPAKVQGTTDVSNIKNVKQQPDMLLPEDRNKYDKAQNEMDNNQLVMQETSEEKVKNTLHELVGFAATDQSGRDVNNEIVPKVDSEPEATSTGSPMEVDLYPSEDFPVNEDNIAFEYALNESEAPNASEDSTHCSYSSTKIRHSNVSSKKQFLSGKANEQAPTSKSPAHQTTKNLAKGTKPEGGKVLGKTMLTKVPGMTYSSKKAILKGNVHNDLPGSPTSRQRPPVRTQSGGALTNIESSNQSDKNTNALTHMTERLSATSTQSLPGHRPRMQSGSASVNSKNPSCQSVLRKSVEHMSASSAGLPSVEATNNESAGNKGSSSCLSKKIQLRGTSTNSKNPGALSASTQKLLDAVGKSPSIDNIGSVSKHKQPQSFIPKNIPKKHVPLKPKILPKADDLLTEVLSWEPAGFLYPQQTEDGKLVEPATQLKERLLKVPNVEPFESFDHYLCTFKPLIFHELWSTIFSDIHHPDIPKPDPIFGNILSVTRAGPRLQVIKWKAFISREIARSNAHPVEDDLLVVDFSQIDQRVYSSALHLSGKELQFRFAMVESLTKDFNPQVNNSRHGPGQQTQCVLVLSLKVSGLEFATNELLDSSEVELKVVTSLKTVRRQWSGLINLHTSILVRDVISPRGGAYFCQTTAKSRETVQYPSLTNNKYNSSQMTAIHSAVQAVSCAYAHPRICLLHGPPGTGKTHTISGMVSVMLTELSHSSNSHRTTSALPGQPHSAALKPTKPRILICTPSNNAIDEIIRKLIKDGVIFTEKHVENRDPLSKGSLFSGGKFRLVRIGKPERIHSELTHLSLDDQAKELLSKNSNADTSINLNAIRSELQHVEAEINKMEKRLNILNLAYKSASSAGPQIMSDINQLKERLARYKNRRQELSEKYKDAKLRNDNNIRGAANARKHILMNADIICSTLSGSASTALRDSRNNFKFSCIIIDEISQCTELDALIPLKYMCSKLVLVGDPYQLQAMVKSKIAAEYGYGQSLLGRFCEHFDAKSAHQENPIQLLKVQYRMYPEICDFPSRKFYKGQLKSDVALSKESERSPFHPFLMFDVINGSEIPGRSPENVEEGALVVELVKLLFENGVTSRKIGVITPYKAQVRRIKTKLKERLDCTTIDVHTVDGFQGREKEFIIISCVRAQSKSGSIGFLSDWHRLNVAITRSKMALYVLGHLKSLKVNEHWRALIDHAKVCNAIVPVKGNHTAVVKRILKTRYLKSQVDGDHHQSGSRNEQEPVAADHQQRHRTMSDSEGDRQHRKSVTEQGHVSHKTTPTDPRTFRPQTVPSQRSQGAATHSHVARQRDPGPTVERTGASSYLMGGSPRRHTTDTLHSNQPERGHSDCRPEHSNKQVRFEPYVNQERESSASRLYQQRPTQLKLSTSTASGHSKHMSLSPDFSPRMAGHVHVTSSLSPNQQMSKGRKRVAHKSDKEIKSQRQAIEHKLSTPVSPTPGPAPPSKRPRMGSSTSSSGGIRADLMKKRTKK